MIALFDRIVLTLLLLFQVTFTRQDGPQKLPLVVWRRIRKVLNPSFFVRPFAEIRHNLERVALVNQVLLPLGRVKHFLCIIAHKRIEKGIKG